MTQGLILSRLQDEVFEDGEMATGGNSTEEQIREIKEQQEVVMKQQSAAVVEVVKEQPLAGHTNGSNNYEPEANTGVGAAMEVEEPISEWKPEQLSSPPSAAPAEQQWKSPEQAAAEVPAVEPSEMAADVVIEDEAGQGDAESAAASSEPGPRTWASMMKSGAGVAAPAPGKPPLAPQNSVGGGQGQGPRDMTKEGTPFSQTSGQQQQGPGVGGKPGPGGGQGGYQQRGQRGSSQGRSPGQQSGPRPDRFSKEEDKG